MLSQINEKFTEKQIAATPAQVRGADGCHLDRETGESIKKAGFGRVEMEYLELERFGFLNPTFSGIATV